MSPVIAAVDWLAWGTLVVGVFVFLATAFYVLTTYLMFRVSVDPHVIVYPAYDEHRETVFALVVENIGRGVAYDISFHLAEKLPARAWGIGDEANMPKEMQDGPLISGIPYLPPGGKRSILWGQYGGIHKWMGSRVIDVTVTFLGEQQRLSLSRQFIEVSRIDIWSFRASPMNIPPPATKALQDIASSMDDIAARVRRVGYDDSIGPPPYENDAAG